MTPDTSTGRRLRRILRQLVGQRAIVAALGIAILGIILMMLASKVATRSAYDEALKGLTSGGIDVVLAKSWLDDIATGPFLATVLWSLGGTLVSIGVIALAWDLWLNTSWLSLVREELVASLTDPTTVAKIRASRQPELLENMLRSYHGDELGHALYRESANMRKATRAVRKNFLYNIEISPGDAYHHRANFRISFTLPKFQGPLTLHFSRVRDSLDFHTRYQELIDRSPTAIYRYVLLSDKVPANLEPFAVNACRVEDCATGRVIALRAQTDPSSTADSLEIQLEAVQPKMRKTLRRMAKHECRITLNITTVVDARRNEFPIWLGYPVKDFRSQMVARSIGVTEIDVLEFFSSSSRYRREDFVPDGASNPQHSAPQPVGTVFASGVLDDLILPHSGLTYIWR